MQTSTSPPPILAVGKLSSLLSPSKTQRGQGLGMCPCLCRSHCSQGPTFLPQKHEEWSDFSFLYAKSQLAYMERAFCLLLLTSKKWSSPLPCMQAANPRAVCPCLGEKLHSGMQNEEGCLLPDPSCHLQAARSQLPSPLVQQPPSHQS